MKTVVWFGFVLGALTAAGKVIVIKPGEKAAFECAVVTAQGNVEWRRDNEHIASIVGKNGFTRKGTGDTALRARLIGTNLEVRGVKEGDAGSFTCESGGRSDHHTLLVVSVSANPSAAAVLGSEVTLQCQVHGLTPVPTVQWKRPGGNPYAGAANKVQLNPVAHSDAGKWECTFEHDSVTYKKSLDITVTAPAATSPSPIMSNDPSKRKPPCPTCVTNRPSQPALLLLGLSWWVWVVIGVGCLIVVLLMVFIFVLYKRIKRKKRKLQKMRNGQQLHPPKQYCQCNRPTAAVKPKQGRRREKPSAPPLQPLLME